MAKVGDDGLTRLERKAKLQATQAALGKRALFLLDDSDPPGQAIVEIVSGPHGSSLGYRLWGIQVKEIIRPSKMRFDRLAPGKKITVSERHLRFD
jgi:hypothetical protein